ncbi:MAG: flagellar hook-associated protein FlgK, partial [Bacillota bacterium]|nr:flagellar hook-associated protein FlgK [Bacillota bacterium]
MYSTFLGLETALRALYAQRGAVEVAAHNVANAQTPGYSRQTARLSTTSPLLPSGIPSSFPAWSMGTGVELTSITRTRDAFLDRQGHVQGGYAGRYGAMDQILEQVESYLLEPGAQGINASLSAYWKAWQDVGNDPTNVAARRVLVQMASSLGEDLAVLDQHWVAVQENVDRLLREDVDRFNALVTQVAGLNQQVVAARLAGREPNDLLDRRDALLDELSRLAPIRVQEGESGEISLSVGGVAVLQGGHQEILAVVEVGGLPQLRWPGLQQDASWIQEGGGRLSGLEDLGRYVVPGYRSQLAQMVQVLALETNALHAQGFDLSGQPGGSFFIFTPPGPHSPLSLQVDPALLGAPEKVAAAASPSAGDGSHAFAMAGLLDVPGKVGAGSIRDAYRSLVGQVGADRMEVKIRAENADGLLRNIEYQRQSVEGVSLDEEVARIVQYQQGYQAAARVITAIDEMISTVVQR